MRWIDKLSPKELLELHKSVVYDDRDRNAAKNIHEEGLRILSEEKATA